VRPWRSLKSALFRLAGLGPKPAAERAGPGFRGIVVANEADIADIVRFELPIFDEHRPLYRIDFQQAATDRQVSDKYRALLGSPDAGAAIYVANGSPIGYVAWQCLHVGQMRMAVVLSIMVEPAHRGTGIARELLDHARQRVRDGGASVLRAHVWAHNAASHAFFQSEGFTPVYGVYDLAIATDEEPDQDAPDS